MPSERSHMAELFGGDSSVDDADMDLFGGNVVGHALLLETNQEVTRSNSNNNSAATTMPVDGAEPEEPLEVRHKRMYPLADAPLPTQWSSKDKYTYIGLSDDGLTVQYKGHGKDHMDAASVRADHPIPASCGLYYFEVKIISKGRDGYFGIGLSGESVSLNRLPGWDKMSYGYHGDDGHSFCSSGTGKPYGPTFSTGDVIGCGVNLVDNSCFYTKNGINLGTAFTDLPPYLYPTVGLQTPGEVLEANFGQRKFVYDIEDDMHGLRAKTHGAIRNFPIANDRGQWNTMLQKMVLMYLMHHGYVGAAEAFAKATGQAFEEEIASVKNRQKIQRMVLEGRISEAIQTTAALYPGLLESKPDLLFMLKTRQFIEMIGGCEPEIGGNGSCPPLPPKVFMCPEVPMKKKKKRSRSARDSSSGSNSVPCPTPETDVEMMDCGDKESSSDSDSEAKRNGLGKCNGAYLRNGVPFGFPNPPIFAKKDVLNKTLAFGRELKHLSMKMRQECGRNETNKKMLEEACSLLAYVNPWDCPLSYLLDPTQRDPVCRALNSAIMERLRLPPHPSLEVAVCQANQLLRTMASVGMGACAFASLPDVLKD